MTGLSPEARLREIDKIVHTPTPRGMSANIHFQRDWDRIRELTKPWHVPVTLVEDQKNG